MLLNMQGDLPLVSVLTPAWNRASYLEKVWQGLHAQSYRNFEWLVADDGSTDGTEEIMHSLAARSGFPVVYIQADRHIGKPRMDNELMARASGDLILWNDSDDWLLPQALEKLVKAWCDLPLEERDSYIGITALCSDPDGKLQSSKFRFVENTPTTWNALCYQNQVEGDMCFLINKSRLAKARFLEVDFMITESSFWKQFSGMKTVLMPEVVKLMDRSAVNRISLSGKMEYCRGKAYGLALAEGTPSEYPTRFRRRIWLSITFWRYAYLGEISLLKALRMWRGSVPRIVHLTMAPIGWAFAVKDLMQRKVFRTHRDFDMAQNVVRVGCSRLN